MIPPRGAALPLPFMLSCIPSATPAEIFANGRKFDDYRKKKNAADQAVEQLVAPYKDKLFEERVALLPPDVQAIVRKPERQRTAAEQKIYDDYFPVLEPMSEEFVLNRSWPETTRGHIRFMARDDDIDYTILGLHILETYGFDFRPEDLSIGFHHPQIQTRPNCAVSIENFSIHGLLIPID